LLEGLQKKYEVFTGDKVDQRRKEVFARENKKGKTDCDETKCLQDIAAAFGSELLATANVAKQDGGYFLAINIRNLFDDKVVYSKSLPCDRCTSFQVVDKLKELVDTPASESVAPAPEPAKALAASPENDLWAEVQKADSADYYSAYLKDYPKGTYAVLAKIKLNKFKEAAASAQTKEEKDAWDAANSSATEESYQGYLDLYPKGRFASLATAGINKLKKEAAQQAAQQARLEREAAARQAAQARAEAANPKAGKVIKDCAECPEMVVVPAGSFTMGSNSYDGEKPVHSVTIAKAFALGKTEITRGQFAAFVNATGYDAGNECYVSVDNKWEKGTGNNWRNPGFQQDDSYPVACINWSDAQAYVEWLARKTGKTYLLPIESQWEYACRAGGENEYCGSDNIDDIAWYGRKAGATTQPTARKQANAFGLYDMSGNVWEWTADSYHDTYNGAPNDGSEWQGDGAKRVLRGGSWLNDPFFARSAYRIGDAPAIRSTSYGFRVSRTLP